MHGHIIKQDLSREKEHQYVNTTPLKSLVTPVRQSPLSLAGEIAVSAAGERLRSEG
jgi:hypothetical protein